MKFKLDKITNETWMHIHDKYIAQCVKPSYKLHKYTLDADVNERGRVSQLNSINSNSSARMGG